MAFAFGSENRWYDQYFDKGKSLAAASFECADALAVGEHHGALAVAVVANGAVSIASTKSIKLSILGSDTEDGEFAAVAGAPEVSIAGGASNATTFEDGDIVCKLVLPDMQRYARIKVTSDTTNTGSIDVLLACLAR